MNDIRAEAKFETDPEPQRPAPPVFMEIHDTDGDIVWIEPRKIASIQWTNKRIGKPADAFNDHNPPLYCRVTVDTGGEFEFEAQAFKEAWQDVFA